MAEKNRKLSTRQYLKAVIRVSQITYKASPTSVYVKLIGSLLSAVLPLATAYFAGLTTTALADAYAGTEEAGADVIRYVIITALLGVALTAWSSIEQYIGQMTRFKVNAAISDQMYEHFLSLDFWRYDDKETVNTYDKAKRFATGFGYMFDSMASIATQAITLIAGLAALVWVSWWLGLILVVAVIPSIVIQFKLSRKEIAHWNSNIEARRVRSMIEWQMFEPRQIAELRLYGMVKHLLKLRSKYRAKDEKERIHFERQYIGKRLIADTLEATAEVIALLYTALQIISAAQPVGQFLYVQQVVSRALGGARGFVSQLGRIDEDMANIFDYMNFMALPERVTSDNELTKPPNDITLNNVSFSYPTSKKPVIKDISMTIRRSQHIAIVGENGAGKSTLIKLLTGLYRPQKGEVLLDGVNLNNYSPNSWHKYLSVLQQEFIIYQFARAKDNIYFGDVSKPLDNARLVKAMHDSEAYSFIEKLPKGVENFIDNWMEDSDGTSGVSLSGGQWQRMALARNFYRNSPIIILDEPTSAIDALAESRIFKHLYDSNRTIITVSHRLSTVEKADVIYVLKNGKLVEHGTHKEIVALGGEYYKMFEAQINK